MYRLLIPHIKPSVREIMIKSHWAPGLIVPPGQQDHRSTKGPVSHHVARPQSTNMPCTASEPRPQNKRHTIHDSQCVQITLPAAATPQFGNIASVRTPTGRTCSQLQRSTQANVSIVLYGLLSDRRCSPGSVATGYACSRHFFRGMHKVRNNFRSIFNYLF